MIHSPTDYTDPRVADLSPAEAMRLFSGYLHVTGIAHTGPEVQGDPRLIGKRLAVARPRYAGRQRS